MKISTLKIKINVLYYIVFGALACISPFLTPYFQSRGLSYSQIGILLAVYSIIGVLAQPFWGVVTDKYADKKTTIVITMAVSGVFAFAFIIVKDFYSILIAILIFMFFQSPIISVNDANTYDLMEEHNEIHYGKVRLMGSVGYAVTSLFLGIIIKITSTAFPFLAYSIFSLLGLVLLASIKGKRRRSGSPINSGDIVKVMRNKSFMLISFSALFANIAYSAHGNYISVLIQKTGGDVANLGMLWFIVAMSELPVFFFERRIMKRYGALNLYIFGMMVYILRFFLISLCRNYQAALAIQLLQGITFPFYLISTLKYVNDTVSPETRTTAVTAFSAIAGGIGGFLGNMGGGFLLQSITIFQLYQVFAILCILSVLIALILKRVDRKRISAQ